MSKTTKTPDLSRAMALNLMSAASFLQSADVARIDWLHDTDASARFIRKIGAHNWPTLRDVLHRMFGIGKTQRGGKLARAAAVKRNKGRTLSQREQDALTHYNTVSQTLSRAKGKAFGVAKPRVARKAVKLPRGAKTLLTDLKALGVTVKVVSIKAAK